jgi:AcrR family transcriptional regulator
VNDKPQSGTANAADEKPRPGEARADDSRAARTGPVRTAAGTTPIEPPVPASSDVADGGGSPDKMPCGDAASRPNDDAVRAHDAYRPCDAFKPDESLRADARRNRARVLEAADAVFIAKGASASTGEIARAAGVGIGTVFRHFPTKEALLEAIVTARMQRLSADAESQVDAADPGEAFYAVFERMVQETATKKVLTEALARAGVDVNSVVAPFAVALRRAVGELLTRAQAAGAVRQDVGTAEVIALLMGAARSAEHAAADAAVAKLSLQILFDGLRPR